MKKTFALFILLIFSTSIQAQDKKFNFGASLFPNMSKGIIHGNDQAIPAVEAFYKDLETWKFSYSANIFVEYKLNEKSAVGAGLGFQNTGIKTKKTAFIFGLNPSNGQPVSDPSLPTHGNFAYNQYNLELPLYYKRKFGEKLYLIAGASVILNLINTSQSRLYYADNKTKKNSQIDNSTNFRKINFTGNLGFGFDYLKREKITLFVHPYGQFGILGLSKSAILNRNMLSLGISTGIRI